jgi:hypothetical protein
VRRVSVLLRLWPADLRSEQEQHKPQQAAHRRFHCPAPARIRVVKCAFRGSAEIATA